MKKFILIISFLLVLLTACTFLKKKYEVIFHDEEETIVYHVEAGKKLTNYGLELTRFGYTFSGWIDANGYSVDIFNIAIQRNYELFPSFSPNHYQITFDYNGATANNGVSSLEVVFNAPIGQLPTPTKTDDVFVGWYSNDVEYRSGDIYLVANNLTLTASWGATEVDFQYHVLYYFENLQDNLYVLNDTLSITSHALKGTLITAALPEHVGYEVNPMHESSLITSPLNQDGLTLKVFYQRLRFNISFQANNGQSVIIEEQKWGYTYTSLDIPQRDGYSFVGWYLNSSFSGSPVTTLVVQNDLTLYAKWIFGEAVSINFHTNIINQSLYPDFSEVIAKEGLVSLPSIPSSIESRYYITGWYQLASANSYSLIPWNFSSPVTTNLDLYAIWADNGFNSVLSAAVGEASVFDLGVNYASQLGIDANIYQVYGYKSTGTSNPSYQNPDGTIRLYRAASGQSVGNYLEIIATYQMETITILYDSSSYALNSVVYANGQAISPSINGLNYTYVISSNTFTIVNESTTEQVRIKSITITSSFITLNPYLSYALGDSASSISASVIFNDGANILPPYVTTTWSTNSIYLDGDGIYTTPNPGLNVDVIVNVQIIINGLLTSQNFNLSLRATHYVYFYGPSGVLTNLTQIIPHGRLIVDSSSPTIEGYEFSGWYTSSSYETLFDFFDPINLDTYIYGQFTPVSASFIVRFYDANLSVLAQESVLYNDLVSAPASSLTTISGFTFLGWFTSSSYLTPFDFNTPITANTDIYGKWEEEVNYDSYYTYAGNYYNGINFQAPASTLRANLHTLLQTYTKKSYGDVRWILEQSDSIDYDIVVTLPTNGIVGKFYLVPQGIHYRIYEFDRGLFNYLGESAFNFQIVTSLPGTLSNQVYYLIKNGANYDLFYNSTTKKFSIPYTEKPEVIWGIYDNSLITAGWPSASGNVSQSGVSGSSIIGTWNDAYNYSREHVWCNSKLGVASMDNSHKNQGSDAHNLRAIKQSINASRSNRYYEENNSSYTPYTIGSDAFYPGNAFKGDVARILMYMDIMYEGPDNGTNLVLTNNLPDIVNNSATNYTPAGAFMGLLSNMVRWSLEDPVDSFEMARNNYIASIQGNRNPFIDLPYLAELIYGAPIPHALAVVINYFTLLREIQKNLIITKESEFNFLNI